ncbi:MULTISPECIES: LysE family translocator [Rhizobiaceae]|uniref:Threonine/homoserine/homoserine lactone efflux protein n=1 Tax=Aliirhizobium cellulosilyticum TaxID=393664 RepID=A0A7W6S8I3_9HYPH|nr:LysE family translocator [Rhizobium cellulosilyticum]MBB4349124.1 threonine/homoserine/homoserine lactone efflux protein [Rhizobium cellulosilyticum]MBB4412655.1 threonine/homoserine/homoserine lactone efflux protein [Rhizobium cellulosilyticum]MBB4447287.1 threonine/homoserine/homoserine lactone efflux protein [Rhizobium cellulosilyticum]
MTLASVLVFAAALFVAAGSPGPSIAALVSRVLTKGWRDVLPFLMAMWVGETVWLSFAVAGLSAIAESFQPVFVAIKWIGVAYLLYLAWKMWFARTDGADGQLPESRSAARMFFAGLTVTLGNPKIMMFYVALLPSIIDLNGVTLIGWLELVAAMLIVLATVDIVWITLANKARQFLKSPRALKLANRISAGTMAGAAAAIATR